MAHKRPSRKRARKAARRRGQRFEAYVRKLLEDLAHKFPDVVKVRVQPMYYESSRQHRPDFELEYKLGGLQHGHLIECQDRNSYSYDLADKIYAVRGTTERNRYIFVYNDSHFVKTPQGARLKAMGVVTLGLKDFESFIRQLEADIALRELGLQTLRQQGPVLDKSAVTERFSKTSQSLLDSARKNNSQNEYPEDRSMLSS